MHNIPVGTLVEVMETEESLHRYAGTRLYVVHHNRHDGTYALCANRYDTEQQSERFANRRWVHGLPEYVLTVIRLPEVAAQQNAGRVDQAMP